MNDRIKELIRDVGFTNSDLGDGRDQMLIEFAELIVQECIDYCSENLSKTVGGALKIHFGMKNE
jgi:hypothetical protein